MGIDGKEPPEPREPSPIPDRLREDATANERYVAAAERAARKYAARSRAHRKANRKRGKGFLAAERRIRDERDQEDD